MTRFDGLRIWIGIYLGCNGNYSGVILLPKRNDGVISHLSCYHNMQNYVLRRMHLLFQFIRTRVSVLIVKEASVR